MGSPNVVLDRGENAMMVNFDEDGTVVAMEIACHYARIDRRGVLHSREESKQPARLTRSERNYDRLW